METTSNRFWKGNFIDSKVTCDYILVVWCKLAPQLLSLFLDYLSNLLELHCLHCFRTFVLLLLYVCTQWPHDLWGFQEGYLILVEGKSWPFSVSCHQRGGGEWIDEIRPEGSYRSASRYPAGRVDSVGLPVQLVASRLVSGLHTFFFSTITAAIWELMPACNDREISSACSLQNLWPGSLKQDLCGGMETSNAHLCSN